MRTSAFPYELNKEIGGDRMEDVRTPWQKEWDNVCHTEETYLRKNGLKKRTLLNSSLDKRIPDSLQEKLDKAFAKAFEIVFEKGTDVIEKTFDKEEMEHNYKLNAYAMELREDTQTLRKFSKNALASGAKNLLLSGVEGVGLGVLGIGIPDIPLFVGMLLKGVYETSLHYGYDYDTDEERFFILKLIEASCLHSNELVIANEELNDYIEDGMLPDYYDEKAQIRKTSAALSEELIYMKFLQGVPVVGALGGAYDAVYMQRVLKFAKMKYYKRFLKNRRK